MDGGAAMAERGSPEIEHGYRTVVAPALREDFAIGVIAAFNFHRGTPTASENGRHPPSLQRKAGVSDRIHTLMDPTQSTRFHAPPHCISGHPRGAQLTDGDRAVLPRGNFSDAPVGTGAFCVHMTHKAPGNADSPPVAP
jgi:hypothetical protein